MPDVASVPVPDPAVERMERRLRLLQEISDIGMQLMRTLCVDVEVEHRLEDGTLRDAFGDALAPDALAAVADAAPRPRDPATAFAKLSRAVRLTLSLEARTDEALRQLRAGVVVERAQRVEKEAEAARGARVAADVAETARVEARVERLRDIVLEAAEREIDDTEALSDVELALDERLGGDPAYAGLADLPLEETVRRLCADLELEPDWSRWAGEGWAPPEPFQRPARSSYASPSRKPGANYAAAHAALAQSRQPLLE
jgi:hypothetical protein